MGEGGGGGGIMKWLYLTKECQAKLNFNNQSDLQVKSDLGPGHSQFLQYLRGELLRHSAESGLGGDGLESFGKGWGGVYKGVGVKAFGPPRANLLSTTLLLCSPASHSALQICSLKLQCSATLCNLATLLLCSATRVWG